MQPTKDSLQMYGKDYERRLEQFQLFATLINELVESREIPSLRLLNTTENEIRVRFIGLNSVLRFEYVVDEEGRRASYIAAFRLDATDNNRWVPLVKFEFDANGRVRPFGNSDWTLTIGEDSLDIFFNILARKPSTV